MKEDLLDDILDQTSVVSALAKARAFEAFLMSMAKDTRFQDFVREILLAIGEVVKSEAGSIIELNHESKNLFFRAAYGSGSDRVHSIVIPLGKGIVGHVAESKTPMVVNEVAHDGKHLKAISEATGFTARSLIAIPMIIRGRVYGVLELLNKVGGDYTEEDQDLLVSLANGAAKAIEVRLMLAWSLQAAKTAKPSSGPSGVGEAA